MPLWKRNLIICWFGSFATAAGIFLVFPFIPLYVEQLGVRSLPEIEKWSGYVLSASPLISAVAMPIWGKLSDMYGRKPMLIRASLGIAVTMFLMGFAQNVYQLLALRLLMGAVMGYVPTAIILVASQTPKEHLGWALSTLSTGQVSGSLLGPLIGGLLSDLFGVRPVFYLTSLFLFIAFLVTYFFIKESFVHVNKTQQQRNSLWHTIANPQVLIAIFLTTFMLQLALMSVQPVLTIYIEQLMPNPSHITLISGAVFAATGLATVLVAPSVGRLSDRVGPRKVLLTCLVLSALVIIPQAFVQSPWQLMFLRFLMGLTVAGLLPSINTLIKNNVPDNVSGTVYGYNSTSHSLGNVAGPIIGGHIAASWGIPCVLFTTSFLLLLNAFWVYYSGHKKNSPAPHL